MRIRLNSQQRINNGLDDGLDLRLISHVQFSCRQFYRPSSLWALEKEPASKGLADRQLLAIRRLWHWGLNEPHLKQNQIIIEFQSIYEIKRKNICGLLGFVCACLSSFYFSYQVDGRRFWWDINAETIVCAEERAQQQGRK